MAIIHYQDMERTPYCPDSEPYDVLMDRLEMVGQGDLADLIRHLKDVHNVGQEKCLVGKAFYDALDKTKHAVSKYSDRVLAFFINSGDPVAARMCTREYPQSLKHSEFVKGKLLNDYARRILQELR